MTTPSPNVTGSLLGLHALTSLHAGAGTALGTVDLPVQRERHTHWPTIAGSALKGILRDACREGVKGDFADDGPDVEASKRRSRRQNANRHGDLVAAFGPDSAEADKHAGALSITDARLLAFPVRSLKGVFAWVSCPGVLDRLRRDVNLARLSLDWKTPTVDSNHVLTPSKCPCLVDATHVVLEEFELVKASEDISAVATWIATHLLPAEEVYQDTRERFARQFLILHDDDFTHFARHATEVSARIALDYDSKTVKGGALFYQEFLPPETLLYSVVLANAARAKQAADKQAAQVFQFLKSHLPSWLQVGGDETTGKGFCAVRLWTTS